MGLTPSILGGQGDSMVLVNDGTCDVGYIRMTGNGINAEFATITSTRSGVATARVYELDTAVAPGSVVAGRVRVDISASATGPNTVIALVAAINADGNRVVDALDVGGDICALVGIDPAAEIAIALNPAPWTNGLVSGAALTGASARLPLCVYRGRHIVTAENVLAWASGVATGEVPIGACNTTATPFLVAINRYTAAGGIASPITLDHRFAAVNAEKMGLFVLDAGAVLVAGNILEWFAIAATE